MNGEWSTEPRTLAVAEKPVPCPASSIGAVGMGDRHFKWLLVAPAVLLILALSIYPLLFSLWVAFVNYDFQVPGHAFVGLKNFRAGGLRSRGALVAGRSPSCCPPANVTIEFLLGLASGADDGERLSAAAA